jgi:hypothetical protein
MNIYLYKDNIKVGLKVIGFEYEESCLRYIPVAVSGINGTEISEFNEFS